MYAITFDVHIVEQQEIESPVEVIAIRHNKKVAKFCISVTESQVVE